LAIARAIAVFEEKHLMYLKMAFALIIQFSIQKPYSLLFIFPKYFDAFLNIERIMAGVVTQSSTTILTKFGTSIAGAAGSWLFTQGLNALEGGSESDKINQGINEVLKEVDKINKAVQNLSQALLDDVLTLRTDELQQPMDDINALYIDISQIINTVLTLPATLSTADRATQVQDAQNRLESRLKDCANDVPKYLTKINSFLTETTTGDQTGCPLLQQIAQKCLDDSTDFLGYYGRTKAIVQDIDTPD
jgi:hypothetical protein